MEDDRVYSTSLQVHPEQITLYTYQVAGKKPTRHLTTYLTNFAQNKHDGNVSKTATKKISRALDYMLFLAKPKTIPEGYRGAGLKFRISFITLTLPAKQIHTDREIIHTILQPTLDTFRKKYKIKNYIWRAEKQKNGNLHFHIILDKFIPYQELRSLWNKNLQILGYVSAYRAEQLEWHKNDFRLRKNLLKFWDETRQQEAYLKGTQCNWNNPNTTDVHSTKKVRNLKKYLCKYLTKKRFEVITDESINKETVNSILSSTGRLWACSESLSQLKGARADLDTYLERELAVITENQNCKVYTADHYTIFLINIKELDPNRCPIIYKIWQNYILETFPSD